METQEKVCERDIKSFHFREKEIYYQFIRRGKKKGRKRRTRTNERVLNQFQLLLPLRLESFPRSFMRRGLFLLRLFVARLKMGKKVKPEAEASVCLPARPPNPRGDRDVLSSGLGDEARERNGDSDKQEKGANWRKKERRRRQQKHHNPHLRRARRDAVTKRPRVSKYDWPEKRSH